MTILLDRAVEATRELPAETQDDLARVLLRLIGNDDEPVYQLTPEERDAIGRSRAQAARGEFATDEEVRQVWAKHGF